MLNLKRSVMSVLFSLMKDETLPVLSNLSPQQKLDYWVSLYENPIFRAYLNQRKEWLKTQIASKVIQGDSGNAWIYTGQMLEVLELAKNAKSALEKKQAALEKARKLKVS